MKKKLHLKAGDQVIVIAGKDKGKGGKITKVLLKEDRILVDGINQVKRHTRATQSQPQGGVITKSLPIHVSNLMLVDPEKGTPTRVGRKKTKVGSGERWVRYAKKSGAVLS